MVLCVLLSHAGWRRRRRRRWASASPETRRRMPRLGRTLAARILAGRARDHRGDAGRRLRALRAPDAQTADAQAIEQAAASRVDRSAACRRSRREVVAGDPTTCCRRSGRRSRRDTGASYVVDHRPHGAAVLPPQPGPDRAAHRGAGGRPRRAGAHGHRRGEPRPLGQRPRAHLRRRRDAAWARSPSASSSPRSGVRFTAELPTSPLYTAVALAARRRGLAPARARPSSG